jgi:NADH:ubiquinone oxidoreductase subunit 6 (subunit J)
MAAMDLQTFLFWVIGSLTAICAIAVVVSQNIVRAAVWLLFTLAGTAGVFFLLGAPFVGATQLLVYVGGILVLVVFGVMLTAQGPFVNLGTGPGEWGIAAMAGLLLFAVLSISVTAGRVGSATRVSNESAPLPDAVAIGESLLNIKEATPPSAVAGVAPGSEQPRTAVGYLLPFEIVSVHLLVVLIGAAYLARAKRRRGVAS